jgi:hypothetical protein
LSEFLESKNIDFMPFDSTLDSNTPLLVGLSKNKKQYDKDAKLIRDYVKNGGYAVFFEVKGETAKKYRPSFERNFKKWFAIKRTHVSQMAYTWGLGCKIAYCNRSPYIQWFANKSNYAWGL